MYMCIWGDYEMFYILFSFYKHTGYLYYMDTHKNHNSVL
jgi:hypothetical protein